MAFVSLQPEPVTAALRAPLAIVMPIYNEEANIRAVVDEWSHALASLGIAHQFLLINDGSKDGTLQVLARMEQERPDALVVIDKPNSGHGRSCRLGYDAACGSPAVEWILQIDSDGQCDPGYFAEFWRRRAEADCVFGTRVKRDDGMLRTLTSKLCRYGSMAVAGTDMGDPNVPYRLMRKEKLAAALKHVPPSFDIHNVAVTYMLKRLPNTRWQYVPIRFRDRQGGSNSINVANVAQMGVGMLFDLRKLRKTRPA